MHFCHRRVFVGPGVAIVLQRLFLSAFFRTLVRTFIPGMLFARGDRRRRVGSGCGDAVLAGEKKARSCSASPSARVEQLGRKTHDSQPRWPCMRTVNVAKRRVVLP